MILADVGNTRVHIYEDGYILHLELEDALEAFGERIVHYICVSDSARKRIVRESYWRDVSERIELNGSYPGMGVDRRALCLSRGDGLYVDAGSALTVDRVSEGTYRGGFLLPGLRSYRSAYASVSPLLDLEPDWGVETDRLPVGTREQMGYGIIASVVGLIASSRKGLPLYITGGDGGILAAHFEDAVQEEGLVFEGMLKALEL